mgnify:CR=1 FL=1
MVTHFIFISLYEIRFQLGMEPSQTPHNPVKQLQRRQMAQALFILNGSNLNMLGTREPAVYGTTTLTEIEKSSKQLAESLGLECDFRQTNHEGILVDWIQEAAIKDAAVIINPAGFSFGCVPVLDALKLLRKPLIEVHITNIHQRPIVSRGHFVGAGDVIADGASTIEQTGWELFQLMLEVASTEPGVQVYDARNARRPGA